MADTAKLFCTPDDDGSWLVWFVGSLGKIHVLESFDTEAEAKIFWQDQIDSTDYDT